MIALFVIGGGNLWAKKYYADLSGASAVGNATWAAASNTFAWTKILMHIWWFRVVLSLVT